MLEQIVAAAFATTPVRFQVIGDAVEAARTMGFSEANIDSLIRFIRERGRGDTLDSYLDRPLQPKPQLGSQSRFSDGSFPVFYSALDAETAKTEIIHLRSVLGQGGLGTAYYYEIRCSFQGTVKDLRAHLGQFPYLVQDEEVGAYDSCNLIGREARNSGLDGIHTMSARRQNGECLPVFTRSSISNPQRGNLFSFSVDAATGQAQITEHPA